MREETITYVMLFCALILVRNSKATLEQSLMVVPLFGAAKTLGEKLAAQKTQTAS